MALANLASGYKGTILEGNDSESLERDFKGVTCGLVRLHPDRWLYPADYLRFADKLYNFEFRPSDVVVMTWPKCGTTWMQEIVWTMRNSPNMDHPDHRTPINNRVPFLDTDMFLRSNILPPPNPESSTAKEFARLCPGKNPEDGFFMQMSESLPDPRTIKTHLPFSHFAPSFLETSKIIYVARHPKDVVVSYHHHCQLFKAMSYVGTFDQFIDYFVGDDLIYGPYWLHVKEAFEKKEHRNLHFVFYEDLKNDITGELKKINDFLGTRLSDEQIEKIRHYTSFEEMKSRDNVFKETKETDMFTHSEHLEKHGGFFREGTTGSWKTKLTAEQNKKIEDWMLTNMASFGINFKEKNWSLETTKRTFLSTDM